MLVRMPVPCESRGPCIALYLIIRRVESRAGCGRVLRKLGEVYRQSELRSVAEGDGVDGVRL